MARSLFILNLFFVVVILLILIGTRIYACCKIKKLYDELSLGHADDVFGNARSYARKYVDMVSFRNRFYPFLSYYLKEVEFNSYHDYFETFFPESSRKIDSLYSR